MSRYTRGLGEGTKKTLIGEKRFQLKGYGLKKKSGEGKAVLELLQKHKSMCQNPWEAMLSTEFGTACPVRGPLVSDPGCLWAASSGTGF